MKTNYKKNMLMALEFIEKKSLIKEYTKFALDKIKKEIKILLKEK